MFDDFLASNRDELIDRCKAKVAKRFEPSEFPTVFDSGVPLFLRQLEDTLRLEPSISESAGTPADTTLEFEMAGAAAEHGAELLRLGFTIDQVVHEYGDICQAVTELAAEREYTISTDEFRTLNRCLDDAIAAAVNSFSLTRERFVDGQAQALQISLELFSEEHGRLVEIALWAFSAIKTGNVGVTGATGALLFHALGELRSLPNRTLPEIRV